MKKIIFDTNVLLINPDLINKFSSQLVIPMTILNELDFRKTKIEHQELAQLALLHINQHKIRALKANSDKCNNDDKILLEALAHYQCEMLFLVSDDIGMRNRAESYGIESKGLVEFLNINQRREYQFNEPRKKIYQLLREKKYQELAVQLKVSNGNFNFYLQDGYTPLIESIRSKNQSNFEFLINSPSIDLNLLDQAKLKMPAFMHAAQSRQIYNMDNLIKAGVNPYLTSCGSNSGNSALLIAAWDGVLDVIRFLIEHPKLQLSLNQADGNGFTPLIKACIKGHVEIVKYLLKKNADPYIRDRKCKTALNYAIENKHSAIIKLFNNDKNTFN